METETCPYCIEPTSIILNILRIVMIYVCFQGSCLAELRGEALRESLGERRNVGNSRQSAVVVLGDTRFAVVLGTPNTMDIVTRDFDVASGFKGTEVSLIKNEEEITPHTPHAAWVVSSMHQGIAHKCTSPLMPPEIGISNMFVSGINNKAYLTKIVACPGKPLWTRTIVVGSSRGLSSLAALAIGTTRQGCKRIFVAWNDADSNGISGRFYSTNLDVIGSKVSISDIPADITIDMIWNPISERFITGYRLFLGLFNCEYHNASTFMDGYSLPSVARFTQCDNDNGGHLSWVEIDKNTARNPFGMYAWWTSGEGLPNSPPTGFVHSKQIHIMDRFGAYTGETVRHLSGFEWVGDTQVFTEVINRQYTRSLFQPPENLLGGRYLDHYIGDFHSQNDGIATFTNNIAKRKYKLGRVRAIGALRDHTVFVTSGASADGYQGRRLSVIKNQNIPMATID